MNDNLPPVAAVRGEHAPGLGAELREVFSRSLSRAPGGAQLCVSLDGERLLDVAGGTIDVDTPVQVFSVSKLIVALAAAHAHANGVLDLDAPVMSYWPAFDRPSTAAITARQFLDHSAGIPAVDTPPLSVDDLLAGALDDAIEQQEPYWEPGSAHGYSAFTYGALMAGVFRHATDATLQRYATTHIVEPAGGGFWFGAPDEVAGRVAALTFDPPVLTEAQGEGMASGTAIRDGAMAAIMADSPGFFGDPQVVRADWPSLSGVSSARALTGILEAALGLGGRDALLTRDAIDAMIAERSAGFDRLLGHVSRYGSGVELPQAFVPYFGGRSFGHQGAGGAVAAADPDTGLVFAYTSTHSQATVGVSDQAIVLMAAARQLVESR